MHGGRKPWMVSGAGRVTLSTRHGRALRNADLEPRRVSAAGLRTARPAVGEGTGVTGALTRLQHVADASPRAAQLRRLQAAADHHNLLDARRNGTVPTSPLSGAPDGLMTAMAHQPLLALAATPQPAQRRADSVQREGGDEEPSQQGSTPATATTPALPAVTTAGVEPTAAVTTVTKPLFRNGTTVTDVVGMVSGGFGVADAGVRVAKALGEHTGPVPSEAIADAIGNSFLPGVSEALSVVGLVDNGIRAQAASDRKDAMTRNLESTNGSRAKHIIGRGVREQDDEYQARATAATFSGAQVALTTAALGMGPATPWGMAALASAAVLGGPKALMSAYRFVRKQRTKDNASAHAQNLLFAAQSGDPGVIAMLQEMNVPITDPEDPKKGLEDTAVWDEALARLVDAMPRDTEQYPDGGSGMPGESVDITERVEAALKAKRDARDDRYVGIGDNNSGNTSGNAAHEVNPLSQDAAALSVRSREETGPGAQSSSLPPPSAIASHSMDIQEDVRSQPFSRPDSPPLVVEDA
jgi:hypothetical protein